MLTILLISSVVLLCVFLASRTYTFLTTVYKIPTPPGLPLIGNLVFVLSDPDSIFDKIRAFSSKYYPIYRLSAFYVTAVSLLDPNDIEIILSSGKHLTKTVIYSFLSGWLGSGLLTSKGEKWRNRRKILTPAFHFSILQQFVTVFNSETCHLVRKLQKECESESFDVVPYITNFTLQSIGETAMGFKNVDDRVLSNYKEAVYQIGRLLLKRVSRPWLHVRPIYRLTGLWQKEKKLVQTLHEFTYSIITEREKGAEATYSERKRLAMLDLLLKAKTEGADIDYEGIREEVDTFMFEGHDTTAMAISFILLTLSNLNDIQTKIFEEIIEVLGPLRTPTFDDLQQLKYTERCIKEVLRLFPSVPFIARFSGERFETASGYTVPAGTYIHVHIFDLHRNPRIYPDPLKFDPDRFLPEVSNARHPFAYIPFSAGPRNCIGQRFALLELKAVLCGILRKFVLEQVDDMFAVKFRPDLVLRPATGVRIKILPRL